jgi:hypothetical protein
VKYKKRQKRVVRYFDSDKKSFSELIHITLLSAKNEISKLNLSIQVYF